MPHKPPVFKPLFAPKRVELRGTAASRGYDSAWRRFRADYLRQNPICRFIDDPRHKHECQYAATVVDHIVPLPHGARLDESNVRPVCRIAHDRLTQNLKATGRNELPEPRGQDT